MRKFLWNQNSNKISKPKVSWNEVCYPKYEGGLGVRKIADVNMALMADHVWSILTKRKSLWVEWIHSHKIKDNNFWDIPIRGGSMSWAWRKILQHRKLLRHHIWKEIGNGRETNVWDDMWCVASPLRQMITPREISRAGWNLKSTVADVIDNGVWIWPSAWYDLYPVLLNIQVPVLNQNKQDATIWHDHSGTPKEYSAKVIWDSIRTRRDKVQWADIVWFPNCIPKHAVHNWLVCKRKLKTQDRMKEWDVGSRTNLNLMCCPLCYNGIDSHEHLFFRCPYSKQVWELSRSGINMQHVEGKWEDIMAALIVNGKSKMASSIIQRLVVAASSFFIWQERNNRLFSDKKRSPHQTHEIIQQTVRMKIVTIKLKDNTLNRQCLETWKIPHTGRFHQYTHEGLLGIHLVALQGDWAEVQED